MTLPLDWFKRLPSPQGLAAGLITANIQRLTGTRDTRMAYTQPLGDPGLFGPASMVWRVHRQFLVMMAGGMSSLLLQSLHPQALAAVWDHSRVQTDLRGRLGRTASFIAATTYGPTHMAESVIAHVNAIHGRIEGHGPDGRPYRANDPALLMWVHVAERLGVQDPPRDWARLTQVLAAHQADLRFDERAATVHHLLLNFPVKGWERPLMQALLAAAQDLLPDWVWPILQQTPAPAWRRQCQRRVIQSAALGIQWALEREGVSAFAARRMA